MEEVGRWMLFFTSDEDLKTNIQNRNMKLDSDTKTEELRNTKKKNLRGIKLQKKRRGKNQT